MMVAVSLCFGVKVSKVFLLSVKVETGLSWDAVAMSIFITISSGRPAQQGPMQWLQAFQPTPETRGPCWGSQGIEFVAMKVNPFREPPPNAKYITYVKALRYVKHYSCFLSFLWNCKRLRIRPELQPKAPPISPLKPVTPCQLVKGPKP